MKEKTTVVRAIGHAKYTLSWENVVVLTTTSGRRGSRTPDIILVKDALYQLSYAPSIGRSDYPRRAAVSWAKSCGVAAAIGVRRAS